MADPITEERLSEIIEGTYCGFDEGAAIAAKLLAARADLRDAMELLDAVTDKEPETQAQRWLLNRVNALLAKHKETP